MSPAAWFAAHKTTVLAAGAGLAVLAGLKARHSSSAAGATAPGVSYQGQGGVYDSTANDVYNSIEPQIESLANQLDQLMAQNPTNALDPTTPTSGPPITTVQPIDKTRSNTRFVPPPTRELTSSPTVPAGSTVPTFSSFTTLRRL